MICDRCGEKTYGSILSMFNTETICFDCKDREMAHPEYEEARKVESGAVLNGDYNFPGVGLPEDLKEQ